MSALLRRPLPGTCAAKLDYSLSMVIPAFNEEGILKDTVTRTAQILRTMVSDFEIIVVDDASVDHTPAILSDLQRTVPELRYTRHTVNQQLGGTLLTAFRMCDGKELVFYMDADQPFDLDELRNVLSLADGNTFVLGRRQGRISEGVRRVVLSFAYRNLVRAVFGTPAVDVNFSLKILPRRLLDAMQLKSKSSFIDAEIVIKATWAGCAIVQYPIRYQPRTQGASHLSDLRTIVKLLGEMARFFVSQRTERRQMLMNVAPAS